MSPEMGDVINSTPCFQVMAMIASTLPIGRFFARTKGIILVFVKEVKVL